MPKTDNPQNKKAEKGLGLKDTGGGDIDVVSNVKLACFLNNITEEACATHLHGLGLDGFSISLEAGLEGGHRYLALRECSSFLDCDINVLLATPRENIVRILTVCGRDSWKLAEQKAYSAQSNTTSIVLATHGMLTFENGDKGIRRIAIDALRHAANGPCYAIACKLGMWHAPHYSFSELLLSVTDPGEEADHLFTTLCTHNGNMPPSGFATTAYTEGPTFPANPGQKKNQKPKATPIHVNQFLVRRTFGSHRTNGHSQQPILASVSIIPKKGNRPKAVEFDAFWCPKCGKYFMDERTYLKLKKDGYICCKVIEEKDLLSRQAGTGFYDGLAPESIVHMYGYNVNQQKNLSVAERQMILSFVIENQIQTDQEVAHLLEWLISQHESKPNLTRAVERWRSDLYFVRRHQSPTRKVRVDAIYAKI